MAFGVAACGQTATPPSSALPLPSDAVAARCKSPIVSPSVGPASSVSPKPTKSTATPAPRSRPARWASTPKRIFSGYCTSPTATVDGFGQFHVAAICGEPNRLRRRPTDDPGRPRPFPRPPMVTTRGSSWPLTARGSTWPIPIFARSTRTPVADTRSTRTRSASSTGLASFQAAAGRNSLVSDMTATISSRSASSMGSFTRPSGRTTAQEPCPMRRCGDRRSRHQDPGC